MVTLLVFIMATLEIVFGWKKKTVGHKGSKNHDNFLMFDNDDM